MAHLIHPLRRVQTHSGMKDQALAFAALLRRCAMNKDLCRGIKAHDDIVRHGLLDNCLDDLITMYAKCGALARAKDLFDAYKVTNVITCNILIAAFAQNGQGRNALDCFQRMQRDGLLPDAVTFTSVLKVCGSIQAVDNGKEIHDEIIKQALLPNDAVLGTALVDMYAKCGAIAQAQRVLDELPVRNVINWTALIAGYAQQGEGMQALKCFERMQDEGHSPNAITFICTLKACGSIKAIDMGGEIHDTIIQQGLLKTNIRLGNSVVDMYIKCGALSKALQVLEELPTRNVVSWSALIAGYAEEGDGKQALRCYEQMQREGISPNAVTFFGILKACGCLGAADKGEAIHEEIAKQGLLEKDIMLGTAVVDMYAKCGVLVKARQVLQELPVRDVISWNALIAAYAQRSESKHALDCFEKMKREGISPNIASYICILKSCGSLGSVDKGEEVHDEIAERGLLGKDIELDNALVNMYVKCRALRKAQQVLEELSNWDVISWNVLISGYAEIGEGEQALSCLERMRWEGLSPDAATFTCALKACGSIEAIDKGEKIHEEISKQGLLEGNIVLGNALVDMYTKCGALTKARQLFEALPVRDVISWNALIAGYSEQYDVAKAFSCFEEMQHDGLSPDAVTFLCMLSACSRLGLVEDACKLFLNMHMQYGIEPDLEHYACVVDLFGHAGKLEKAVVVIENMRSANIGVWSILLVACKKYGNVNIGKWAFEHALHVDKCDAAVYALMAKIYTAAGMLQDAENVEAMRMENQAWKPAETGWIREDSLLYYSAT